MNNKQVRKTLRNLPITTIVVAFLFICGGLYLIGFWSTFNIDVTNFIALSDIPKSFILPFVLTQGVFLIMFLTNLVSTKFIKDVKEQHKTMSTKSIWKRILRVLFSVDILFSLAVTGIIFVYRDFKLNPLYWTSSTLIIASFSVYKFVKLEVIRSLIPYSTLRIFLGQFILLLPLTCFSTGKVLSLNIYNNKDIHYVSGIINKDHSKTDLNKTNNQQMDSLKLIGFLGDKLFVSTIDNEKIMILDHKSKGQIEISNK